MILEPAWNCPLEDQACDRVHRIGQTNDVRIVKLCAQDSFEDRMLLRKGEKQEEVTGAFIQGSREDLEQLRLNRMLSILGVATSGAKRRRTS